MKLLVTGAGGLVGRHLVDALRTHHQVYAVHRPGAPGEGTGVDWIAADLTDPSFVDILPDGVDGVVHLAQSRRFREFPDGARDVFGVNVGSTAALLDWCVRTGVRRFVLASSGGIYGYGRDPFTEEYPVGSAGRLGYYQATKHCAELLSENYADHMTVVVLRLFFVYGPGQRPDMFIPRLTRSVAEGRPIRLDGADGLFTNPVNVADAVSAVQRALDLEQSHRINVGGPDVLNLRQIAEAIGARLGRAPLYSVDPAAESKDLIADIGKMTRLLVAPSIGFADGCQDVIRDLGLAMGPIQAPSGSQAERDQG